MAAAREAGWVLIVDDDDLFRRHATRTLARWVTCRSASSPRDALRLAEAHGGLVGAVIDLVLGRAPAFLPEDIPSGVDDVAIPLRALHPALDIRILSGATMDFRGSLARASQHGFGFLQKGSVEHLDALGPFYRRAAQDEARRSADVALELDVRELAANHGLTARQLEIVRLQTQGLTHAQVASRLGVSVKAIEHHNLQSREKTGRTLKQWARELAPDGKTSGVFARRPRDE